MSHNNESFLSYEIDENIKRLTSIKEKIECIEGVETIDIAKEVITNAIENLKIASDKLDYLTDEILEGMKEQEELEC